MITKQSANYCVYKHVGCVSNSRILPITLSTCIRRAAILLPSLTSFLVSFWFAVTDGGRIRTHFCFCKAVATCLKPRSAITPMFSGSFSKYPDFAKMILSDLLPPKPLEIKFMKPWVVMELKYLIVLHFVYSDQVCACFTVYSGFCIGISKQSITNWTFLYRNRNPNW